MNSGPFKLKEKMNEDIRQCVKCHKKEHKDSMCLSINDIIEDYVSEKTIDNFEKKYLGGWGIENYFCSPCASKSLQILENK